VDLAGVFGTTWTLPATVRPGARLAGNVSVVVSNLGNVALPVGQQVTIQFVAHNTTNPAAPDVTLVTLTNQSVTALAAGASRTFTVAVNRGSGLPAGTYQVLATIVPVPALAESNVANNQVLVNAVGAGHTITVA
jgi:hypothetical protein